MKNIAVLFTAAVVFVFSLTARQEEGKILIRNATIVPVEGETLQRGDLLIEDGKIEAVAVEIPVPEGAKIIDASEMFVYPGFIDGYTHLGLIEIAAISSTVDMREMGRENPELKVAWAINPHSVHFKTSRINGTTTALVAPSGGTFPGLSALVKMDGWTIDEMLVSDMATSFINFPMTPRPPRGARIGSQKETTMDVTSKLVEKIKEYLGEARHYLELKKLAAENEKVLMPDLNPKYEALEPVLKGTLPVIISVEKAKDIELALKFVKEEKIRAIFRGCAQGFKVGEKIKEAGVPVIIDDLYTGPSEPEDGYDAPFRNVVELAKAGVTICFSSGVDPSVSKDLPYHAARAVAFGLNWEEAIKALTINPATIFGIDDRVGSIKVGKDADLFITTGDPLDLRSEVKHLFINGKEVDLNNWWKTLYDTWKERPLKAVKDGLRDQAPY
jgi:imidazolonepropionase-like amidohydrolase